MVNILHWKTKTLGFQEFLHRDRVNRIVTTTHEVRGVVDWEGGL